MRHRKRIFSIVSLCFFAATVFGADLNLGTWKLNTAKSRYSPGPAPKSEIGTFEQVGSDVRLKLDRIDAGGKPVHIEWVGRFDGKDYPSQGDTSSDMRSYRKIDEYTFEMVGKKDGKIVRRVTIAYSRDGKTRTNAVTGTNASGQGINNVQVYDRQSATR
jgi:hypothetical protein